MQTVPAKTIVTTKPNSGADWFGTKYNMNIYRGCNHGCIYCDSRSECYRIENFDTVCAKEDALRIIRDDLRRKVQTGVVATGSMSDPYNPHEKESLLTRHALELISSFGFGAAIATKSDLICRDIDVLQEIQQHSPVLCKITLTTTDDALAKKIEPFAPSPSARLEALAKLSEAGIPTCVLLMPVLPFITDSEENIRGLIEKAHQCGVQSIYAGLGVTMRDIQRNHFYQNLDKHFPGLKEKYIARYGTRYSCTAPNVKKLWSVFANTCNQYDIAFQMKHIIRRYQHGYYNGQLSLF